MKASPSRHGSCLTDTIFNFQQSVAVMVKSGIDTWAPTYPYSFKAFSERQGMCVCVCIFYILVRSEVHVRCNVKGRLLARAKKKRFSSFPILLSHTWIVISRESGNFFHATYAHTHSLTLGQRERERKKIVSPGIASTIKLEICYTWMGKSKSLLGPRLPRKWVMPHRCTNRNMHRRTKDALLLLDQGLDKAFISPKRALGHTGTEKENEQS